MLVSLKVFRLSSFMKLSLEAKVLFRKVHREIDAQGITIREENDYILALMELQKRLLKGGDLVQIEAEFELLINEAIIKSREFE